METKVITINEETFTDSDIDEASDLIKKGDIVAFPTETVYGLGANALDENAVEKIFHAKGRPNDNPLIVHIGSHQDLSKLVEEVSEYSKLLMDKFWPGPITLIFRKKQIIPDTVTAGLPTVAIRLPANKIALALIRKSGFPIAAPSANSSGKPSPTTAEHVYSDLNGKIPLIINGGQCDAGIESTVINVSSNPPMILRPGIITLEQIKKLVPNVVYYSPDSDGGEIANKPPTPGMKYRHYSPEAKVILFTGSSSEIQKKMIIQINNSPSKKIRLLITHPENKYNEILVNSELISSKILGSEMNLSKIAQNIFKELRKADEENVDLIFIEGVDEKDEGVAIMNRLKKAASQIE